MQLFEPWELPRLSTGVLDFFRSGAGVLQLMMLVQLVPQARRFMISERWGGYAESSPSVDAIQNPFVLPVVFVVWFAAAAGLATATWPVMSAAVNLLLCRYFFVSMRWRGLARGCGAPGFMAYWMAAGAFILEFARHYAPQHHWLGVLVLQIDFALIMMSAGLYKFTAGYAHGEGMELGLANPQWGYWWNTVRNLPPRHPVFYVMDHLAWGTEVVAAALMLAPPTRFWGAFLMFSSFIFIGMVIRLGVLAEVVALCCVIFCGPGTPGEWAIHAVAGYVPTAATVANPFPEIAGTLFAGCLIVYLALLPIAHAGQFWNFYGKKPVPWQRLHELWTNFFGIIIWRVFSVDHINFFARVWAQAPDGTRTLISRYSLMESARYHHVVENITLTTLFTTQKYFPGQPNLFHRRLVRYARTLNLAVGDKMVFEYVRIEKVPERFEYRPTAEYLVDPAGETVEEKVLDESVSVKAKSSVSPIHEGAKPGSYVPLAR